MIKINEKFYDERIGEILLKENYWHNKKIKFFRKQYRLRGTGWDTYANEHRIKRVGLEHYIDYGYWSNNEGFYDVSILLYFPNHDKKGWFANNLSTPDDIFYKKVLEFEKYMTRKFNLPQNESIWKCDIGYFDFNIKKDDEQKIQKCIIDVAKGLPKNLTSIIGLLQAPRRKGRVG